MQINHSLPILNPFSEKKFNMEGDHDVFDHEASVDTSPAGGASTARWNPTKDQITMLESLYRQGVRTPSADQIQQITARLRAFGHIEGKNVFYWFQNHKARQRQKQKQESMAYINRFHHRPSTGLPVYAPPPPHYPNNVMCGPYYVAEGGEMGYFQQYPKMILPSSSGFRRKLPVPTIRPADQRLDRSRIYDLGSGYDQAVRRGRDVMVGPQNQGHSISQQVSSFMGSDVTLPLFPLHPTGIVFGSAPENVYGVSEDTAVSQYEHPYFDFFSGRSSG